MDETVSMARRALDLIVEKNLPATPPIFELFFHYTTGSYLRLNAELDHLLSRGEMISAEIVEDLRSRHLPAALDAQRLSEARAQFGSTVGRTSDTFDMALQASNRFDAQLSEAGSTLRSPDDNNRIAGHFATLTESMRENVSDFRARLVEAMREFSSLLADLEKAKLESLTDELTGVSNRRHFDDFLERHIAKPGADPTSLVFADVDHFKKVNDQYGHLVGDQVLRLIATTIRHSVREADFVARLGGEEFVIVLPGAPLSVAKALAENIRVSVAAKSLVRRSTGERLGNVTLSLGVATYRSGMSARDILKRSDECLYSAKDRGRNCVVTEADMPNSSR
ncbi:MAG: GGDEF domain-containing protein [Proteobacteria bacterium]|nr:GGDEF domain-containing protein [Pseudomonadota bacterium]